MHLFRIVSPTVSYKIQLLQHHTYYFQLDLPVPGLEGIAGPLEQVALHHHTVRRVHIELGLGVVIGEVLLERREDCNVNPRQSNS